MSFGGYLQANTAVDVLIGPFVDDTDGKTAETALTLSQGDIKLSKNGQALAQKSDDTAAAADANGYYNCELDATDTNTEGNLTLIVHETGALPVRIDYMVLAQAAYISLVTAKDSGFMDVNVKAVSEDTTAADNLESACDNYSATRGLSGTALPAAAADAAGGLVISDAGGLDIDTKLANTNEVTAARMGALTDLIDGGRLDLLVDGIKTKTDTIPTWPTNFANLSITATTGLVDITQTAADKAWGTAARVLTANTNLSIPTVGGIADAVWDEVVTTGAHDTATFAGAGLLSAASAGDPWATAIPGAYGAGTAGLLLGTTIPGAIDAIDNYVDTEITTITNELAKVPKSDSNVSWNATALGAINAEVDTALNTAIPGSPTADSINERVATMDTTAIPAIKTVVDTIQADTDLLDDAAGGLADIHTDIGTALTNIAAVKTVVDTIQADTDLLDDAIGGLADIHTDIGTMQGNVTSILADTGELQTNQGNWLTATGFATPTNITAGTITTTTNLTNLPSIPADWITAAGINTGALTADAFAADAIVAATLATGAITADALAANAITNAAVADDVDVNAKTITAGAIVSATFGAGAIDAAAIKDAAIDLATFAADCKTGSALKANVETITNDAITAAAIANGAIDNATFAADVGSTAYATNIISLAAKKAIDEYDPPTNTEFELRSLAAADYTIVTDLGTVQTGDSYAIVNGDHGLVSIQDDVDSLVAGVITNAAGADVAADIIAVKAVVDLVEDVVRNQLEIVDATGAVTLRADNSTSSLLTGFVTDDLTTTTRTRLS